MNDIKCNNCGTVGEMLTYRCEWTGVYRAYCEACYDGGDYIGEGDTPGEAAEAYNDHYELTVDEWRSLFLPPSVRRIRTEHEAELDAMFDALPMPLPGWCK